MNERRSHERPYTEPDILQFQADRQLGRPPETGTADNPAEHPADIESTIMQLEGQRSSLANKDGAIDRQL